MTTATIGKLLDSYLGDVQGESGFWRGMRDEVLVYVFSDDTHDGQANTHPAARLGLGWQRTRHMAQRGPAGQPESDEIGDHQREQNIHREDPARRVAIDIHPNRMIAAAARTLRNR